MGDRVSMKPAPITVEAHAPGSSGSKFVRLWPFNILGDTFAVLEVDDPSRTRVVQALLSRPVAAELAKALQQYAGLEGGSR